MWCRYIRLKVKRWIRSPILDFVFVFDVSSPDTSFYEVFGLVEMIGRGLGGLGCDLGWFRTIFVSLAIVDVLVCNSDSQSRSRYRNE